MYIIRQDLYKVDDEIGTRVAVVGFIATAPKITIWRNWRTMLAVLGFNAMGDAIGGILDPRMLSRVRGGRAG